MLEMFGQGLHVRVEVGVEKRTFPPQFKVGTAARLCYMVTAVSCRAWRLVAGCCGNRKMAQLTNAATTKRFALSLRLKSQDLLFALHSRHSKHDLDHQVTINDLN
jgi:hypothetical protein